MTEQPLNERLMRVNFTERRMRTSAGVPVVEPEFVAEAGRRVHVVDLREPAEVTGALGHVPGSVVVPLVDVASVFRTLGPEAVVVTVSNHADRAGKAAQYLESLGMQFVAAMDGGRSRWKALGLATSRDAVVFGKPLKALEAVGTLQPGERLTKQKIEAHVGHPGSVRWMRLASFLLHGRRSCVDGRDDHGVIGTPGGDAGEFALALAAFEACTNQRLERAQIKALAQAYVDTFGRFYFHNDTNTVNALSPHLRADARLTQTLEPLREPMQWRTFMKSPPEGVRAPLLEYYTSPEAVGCGHLKLMMKFPERYGVRSGLIADVLHSMWLTRWEGAPEFEYVILGGTHQEAAVVNVTVDQNLWAFSRIPLLSPSVDGQQMFVNHPQVASYLRDHVCEFLLRVENLLPVVPSSRQALAACVHEMGDIHLRATLSVLAKGLPLFEVRFQEDAGCQVIESGTV
jgi:rhodanese-related sulfurtransferase